MRDPRLGLFYLVTDALLSLAGIAAVLLMAIRFNGIGGWTRPQIMFLLGFSALVEGCLTTFFGYNVAWISRRIGRGQLDHNLIQPRPLWTALLTEGFTPFTGSGGLVVGTTLAGFATAQAGVHPDPLWCLLLGCNVLAAVAITLSVSYIWGSLAFSAPLAAEEISSSALQMLRELQWFPLDGMGAVLQWTLLSVLPAGLCAWLPARALVAPVLAIWPALFTPLCALVFIAVAGGCFRLGMKRYVRTGSQRYLSFGHRR